MDLPEGPGHGTGHDPGIMLNRRKAMARDVENPPSKGANKLEFATSAPRGTKGEAGTGVFAKLKVQIISIQST